MAEKKTPATSAAVKVRLLVDSEHGPVNAVVELATAQADAAVKAGIADDSEAAVAYAESLAAAAASKG